MDRLATPTRLELARQETAAAGLDLNRLELHRHLTTGMLPMELEYLSVLPESGSTAGGQILKVSFRSVEVGKDWSVYLGGKQCLLQSHVVRNVGRVGDSEIFLHAVLCTTPPNGRGPCTVSVQFKDKSPVTTASDVVLFTYINVNFEMWPRACIFGSRAMPIFCFFLLNLALVTCTEGLEHDDDTELIPRSGGARPLIFATYVLLLPCVILLYSARSDEKSRLSHNSHMLGTLRYCGSQNTPLIWRRRGKRLLCSFQHAGHLTEFLASGQVCRVSVDCNDVGWKKTPSSTFTQQQKAKVRRLERLVAGLDGRIQSLPEPRRSEDGDAEQTQLLEEFASETKRALERQRSSAQELLAEEGAKDILDECARFGEHAFEIEWPSDLDQLQASKNTELSHKFVQLIVHQLPEAGKLQDPSLTFYLDRDMVRWLMFGEPPKAQGLRTFQFLVTLVAVGVILSCVRILMRALAFESLRFNLESAIFIVTAIVTMFSAVVAIPYYGAAVLTARGQIGTSEVAHGVAGLLTSPSLQECFQPLFNGAHELFMGNVSQEEYQRFSGVLIGDELLEKPIESLQDTSTFMSQYGRRDEELELDKTDPVHRLRFSVGTISGPSNAVVRYGVEAGEDVVRVVPCWLRTESLKKRVIDALFSHRSVAWSGLDALRRGHQDTVTCIATVMCSHFRRVYVLTCGSAGWIKVWDSDGHLMHNCRGHYSQVLSVASAHQYFTSADLYGIVIWRMDETEDGSVKVEALAETGEGGVRVAMTEREGQFYSLAVGMADVAGTLALIWRLPPKGFSDRSSLGGARGLEIVTKLKWHPQLDLTLQGCCALTGDEAAIAVGPTLQVWHFEGRERCTMEHSLPVDSVVLHKTQSKALALTVCGTSGDNAINIWDSLSGSLLRRVSHEDVTSELSLADSDSGVVYLVASSDHGLLASGSADNSAVVWELLPRAPYLQPKLVGLHADDVQCLAFAESCSRRRFVKAAGGDGSYEAVTLRREGAPEAPPETMLFSGSGAEIYCWKLDSTTGAKKKDNVEMLDCPYVVLKSASMTQAVAPTALVLFNFFQLMAFPLSMHYPWHHSVHFMQVFCHVMLLDFEALDLRFDKYYFWLYRFWAVNGFLALCIVWAYSGAVGVFMGWEKRYLQELAQRKLWLTTVATGLECNSHATAERFAEAEAKLKDAGFVKDTQRREERLLMWEEEWRKKSGLDRDTVRRQMLRDDYTQVSPAARRSARIALINKGMDMVMLLFGSVGSVPITRLLVQCLDCTGRSTATGEVIPMLDIAWTHHHLVRCDTSSYRGMKYATIALGLLWAPAMFGLIAANGKARSLLLDKNGKFHRFGFLRWSCFQAASARTTEMMPMGVLTRYSGRLKHELSMAICRITYGALSVLLEENSNRKVQAAAFTITATVQVAVVLLFRPFCHRAMYGGVICLYLAVFFANVSGMIVIYIDDPSQQYPVFCLFGSWVFSLAAGMAIGRCLGHAEEHKLEVYVPGTAWTPFCRRHRTTEFSQCPTKKPTGGDNTTSSMEASIPLVEDERHELSRDSRDLYRVVSIPG